METIWLIYCTHRHCLWSENTGVQHSIGSTHPVVQRLLFPPLSTAVKSALCPPVGSAATPFLSTPQSSTLCGHSNLRPRLPLLLRTSTISWHCSLRKETLKRLSVESFMCRRWCVLTLRSHPSSLGLGSKDQLTNQLSEKSFSSADWELPTVVSFLSYSPEIIQSTGFELQIREEEDDLRDGPTVYGAGAREWKGSTGRGRQRQVYGNRRGPSKIKPGTDETVQFTLHS